MRSSRTLMVLMAVVIILRLASISNAQDSQDQTQPVADPIEQLRLTPEQRQRIRMIAAANKDERQIANRRMREANVALDQALDADPIDESLIQQRINDLAAAQVAQIRMRIQMELRIRRELRPEQLATLRRLRLQVRDVMGTQRPLNRRPLNRRPLNRGTATQGLRPRNR